MKYFLYLGLPALFLSAVFFSGCANTAQLQPANQTAANQNSAARKPGNELSAISHSSENRFQPASTPGNTDVNSNPAAAPGDGVSPMSRAIDVSAMNADIQKAEKKYEKDPKDAEAKKTLAHAYFVRAFALTDAAQYRAALGDFRKGLKLDPDDEEAKSMHDRIIEIFKSIGREPPKEGEEPPPMPFSN